MPKHTVLPKKWRSELPKRLEQLAFPAELHDAFHSAIAVLAKRGDDEINQLAQNLSQSGVNSFSTFSVQGISSAEDVVPDPRTIYVTHTNATIQGVIEPQKLGEEIAVGTLIALSRTCDAVSKANDPASWRSAAQATANARAFAEWTFLLHTLLSDSAQLTKFLPAKFIRAAAKEKIKKDKSIAGKKAPRKELKPHKELVFAHYEQHKSEYKGSVAKAAAAISNAKLVPFVYSTIYTWLGKYVKKAKG